MRKSRPLPERLIARTVAFLGGLCLSSLAVTRPAAAAERVVLTYGFVEISTSLESLRTYAETGKVSPELAPYLRFLDEDRRSQFRQALQVRQDVSPVQLSQFLYSSIGQNILRYAGGIVQTAGRRDGSKGLRGALVLSAADPEGLSVLGIIEKFPTGTVRINSLRAVQAVGAFTQLIEETQQATTAIQNQISQTEISRPSIEALGDLTEAGPFAVTTQFLEIVDTERNRTLPTDLYLPPNPDAPLVVISHGLAGDRRGFINIAQHLASHGFAVAALDHPGSDRRQLEDLLTGTAREIAQPNEFSQRPRDISFLLDELTRLSSASGPLANQIDMSRVGVIGHSFGGYTALALAGAQLNYETLEANCESEDFIFNAANPSMLLQCTALEAPEQFDNALRDERVQAVMALNPVTSSLFGPMGFSQIVVPVLLVAGSEDPIAPALLEQIQPFTWLNQPVDSPAAAALDHYLVLLEGGSHVYDPIDFEGANVALASELVNADVPLAYNYLEALSLGFMKTEVAPDPAYRSALSTAYINRLSQPPLPLYITDTLTEAMITDSSTTLDLEASSPLPTPPAPVPNPQ
ncbi:MAG: alpha/beta hydrolase [Phormidesmis sp.]